MTRKNYENDEYECENDVEYTKTHQSSKDRRKDEQLYVMFQALLFTFLFNAIYFALLIPNTTDNWDGIYNDRLVMIIVTAFVCSITTNWFASHYTGRKKRMNFKEGLVHFLKSLIYGLIVYFEVVEYLFGGSNLISSLLAFLMLKIAIDLLSRNTVEKLLGVA